MANPSHAAPRLDVTDFLDPPLPPMTMSAALNPSQPLPMMHQSHPPVTNINDNPGIWLCTSRWTELTSPVSLGFISRVEAETLTGLYHLHLNPILAHLDPLCESR